MILPLILGALLLAGAVLPAKAVCAEYTIGVIMTGDVPYYRDVHESFMSRLRKDGYGDRVEVIVQKPYPDPMSLSNAARKLIAHEVNVIVTYGTPATLAVVREKTKIPVVYAGVYEPLVSKITARNVVGMNTRASVSSLLRYLRAMTSISNLGVIYSSNEEDSIYQLKELEKITEQYGIKIDAINLKAPQDVKAVLKGRKHDAFFVTGSSIASLSMASIVDIARERRIPTASLMPDRNSKIMVSLYASPREMGDKSAEKVIRFLADGSFERVKTSTAREIELVFDLKELLGMGLKIPMDLVTEATRIIQ